MRPSVRTAAAVLAVAFAFAGLVAAFTAIEAWRVLGQQERVIATRAAELDRQLAQLAIVPRLLADDPRIVAALRAGRADETVPADRSPAGAVATPDASVARPRTRGGPLRVADRLLEAARDRSGAAFVYLMDESGTTLAASNWREPLSFVGINYGYRPYFREAVAGREATFFAVGATTGEPGYFIARPVHAIGRIAGVVVAKVSLEALADAWREGPFRALVTDELGVIILASDPALRYRAAAPLDPDARARLAADRRYTVVEAGGLALPRDAGTGARAGIDGARHRVVSHALEGEPWVLHLLVPEARLASRAALAALATAGVALIALLLARLYRQQRRIATSEQRTARELERLVASRTEALEHAQRALIAESNFAMLGRMSAAINHEINQPLASLRLDLATLRTLTARDDPPLGEIRETVVDGDRTTRRIARVIETLRSLARQQGGTTLTLDAGRLVDDVVATVVRERPAAGALAVYRPDVPPFVEGNPVLLQQALLNLLHNAFDAVARRGTSAVSLTLEACAGQGDPGVRFAVEDDGCGVDPSLARHLFEPFATSAATPGGLGLGLTLARQIAVDHGGELLYRQRDVGSRFELRLPRVDGPPGTSLDVSRGKACGTPLAGDNDRA